MLLRNAHLVMDLDNYDGNKFFKSAHYHVLVGIINQNFLDHTQSRLWQHLETDITSNKFVYLFYHYEEYIIWGFFHLRTIFLKPYISVIFSHVKKVSFHSHYKICIYYRSRAYLEEFQTFITFGIKIYLLLNLKLIA